MNKTTKSEITKLDILAIMIAQFEIIMPFALFFIGAIWLLLLIATKFWID